MSIAPRRPLLALALCVIATGCGDDGLASTGASASTSESTSDGTTGDGATTTTTAAGTASASGTTTPTTTTTAGGATTGATDATTTDATTTDATTSTTTTTSTTSTSDDPTGGVDLHDPDQDGPWTIAEIKGIAKAGDVDVPVDCFYPTGGPEPGPYPVVIVAHGFQLPASQYTSYVKRLATHGYVAVNADYEAGLFNPDHVAYAGQLLAAIDWVAAQGGLAGIADTDAVGLTGHSLGGKISVLGATLDPRVRASITLDPVDSSVMCNQQKCPDVSALLPIDVPLGFVGETLDSMGGFMPCAPAADNFLTFYQGAGAPALAVTVLGANHMSFVDDVDACGINCTLCQPATLDNPTVNALARAYVVAFYGRWLKGIAGYDAYLTGAEAEARYVAKGLATIQAK
ncbi:MAG: dienelactone hydrolase family protein [Nannocystaceae bacterium]